MRDAIRDAVIEVASEAGFASMTMEKVAERAGVSPSTVYRYFSDRDDLLSAIMRAAYQQAHIQRPTGPDDIAGVQEQFMADLDNHRELFRAIVVSRVGQQENWSGRQERLEYWRELLDEVTDNLDTEEARRAKAVIAYMTGGLAWLTMADESGLDGTQAGLAVGWAIRTLIADLRARNGKVARGRPAAPGAQRSRSRDR